MTTGVIADLLTVDSDVWQILVALGTLSAVVVSALFGITEGRRARRDRRELIQLRKVGEERERRTIAGLVTAWVVDKNVPDSSKETYRRSVVLHVANESEEPVVNATVMLFLTDGSRPIGPLAAPTPIPVIPPRREFEWDVTIGIAAFEDNTNPLVELGFTDGQGRRWLRKVDGSLVETTGKDTVHYAQEDPEAAERQLGDLNPWRNPMAAAFLFAHALWKAPEEFTLKDLLDVLDPLAKGWQGEWTEERVGDLRVLLADYNNLAAFVWYGAPTVAYARLFSDAALGQVAKAGTGVAVDGCFVTLVYRAAYGWRVFGVGARSRPDEIHFPEFGDETGQEGPQTSAAGVPVVHGSSARGSHDK